ncbi:MAG: hypothetical protein UR28_C0015G0029 [Candidatus Peregrinibacteria bacterium GW2011_GWF2_33_10]|nr:MAG: hypothetical protein UR28_C0015G0029 [Candidatus Peregrinibacteria bacterium GW2011_GWF2_33_10]OGJ44974.1 MAG: hypothetical protein A2263_02830 [Candidatus Peregrinibacteria bacterium RIFOXYA2_FULL_33_21]OGJ46364.1 MAG: hypothetical protein A2272_01105 [Candidatus Peregrinibacteria bacterium RIFOXYA12_FULL_33_12]OGJ50717.1 MAG: hypothetical protein A2307_03645 [Candidatus Peregrinibacteria bacterium RIFOXYB2_FULL_33_20]
MKTAVKYNIYLFITALVLVIFLLADYGFSVFGGKISSQQNLFPTFAKDTVNKIVIYIPGKDLIEIDKNNNQWVLKNLNNYLADQDLMNNFLTSVQELKSSEVVSKNANNLKTYGLDDINAAHLKLSKNDSPLADIYIGKPGPSYNSQFVKLSGDNKVFLVNENLGNKLLKTADDLRDKTIIKIDPSLIKSLTIAGQQITDLTAANNKFNPLNANGFIDAGEKVEEDTTKEAEPFAINIVTTNKTITINVGKMDKNGNYFVTTSESNQMFTVNSYIIDELKKLSEN